jgi:hypothetical protein
MGKIYGAPWPAAFRLEYVGNFMLQKDMPEIFRDRIFGNYYVQEQNVNGKYCRKLEKNEADYMLTFCEA